MSLTGAGEAAHVEASRSSADFWDVLQMPAFMGRVFRADECQPGRDGEAVLSLQLLADAVRIGSLGGGAED